MDKSLLTQNHPNKPNLLISILKIIAIIIILIGLGYIYVNFDAFWKKVTFAFSPDSNLPIIESTLPSGKNLKFILHRDQDLLFLASALYYPTPPKPSPTPTEEKKEEQKEEPTSYSDDAPTSSGISSQTISGGLQSLENQLIIPALGIRVPIVWDSSTEENAMLANLHYGVVHYAGTAKPDEGLSENRGNIFISGHSSYYSWDPGSYKTIFATLPNINVGDQVAIGYQGKVYVFQVYDKAEVSPGDTDVVRQDTDKHIVTLMTCVPIGTNLRRFIARAEFIGYAE